MFYINESFRECFYTQQILLFIMIKFKYHFCWSAFEGRLRSWNHKMSAWNHFTLLLHFEADNTSGNNNWEGFKSHQSWSSRWQQRDGTQQFPPKIKPLSITGHAFHAWITSRDLRSIHWWILWDAVESAGKKKSSARTSGLRLYHTFCKEYY